MHRGIKYISFYDNIMNKREERYVVPSCQSKLEYVVSVISELGYFVDIISPSCTTAHKGVFRAKVYDISPNVKVHLPFSFGASSVIGRAFKRIWQVIVVYFYLFNQINNGDVVIAYHSIALSRVLRYLKRTKGIKLVLHVEEVYSDVSGNARHRKLERDIFNKADAFLFPSESLSKTVNLNYKKYVVAHGVYKPEPMRAEKWDDGRTHCVYAGTFDAIKGGAIQAIKAAEYLDERFCIHVIGFGSPSEIKNIEDLISGISKTTKCEIVYDGLKKGVEFSKYIQKCHIGISSQNPSGIYNSTSFPSKVLMYLTNYLDVVSIRIPVLSESDVNEVIFYYDKDEPCELANAIRRCSQLHDKEVVSSLLFELHKKFSIELDEMLRAFY